MKGIEHEMEAFAIDRLQDADDSSVKEVDVEQKGDQVSGNGPGLDDTAVLEKEIQPSNQRKHPDILEDGLEIEELLKAGRDELLKTSILALRHLSDEKIISLMQLIVDSGHKHLASSHTKLSKHLATPRKKLSNTQGFGFLNKLITRMKAFISDRLIIASRSQLTLYKMLTMSRSRTGTVGMSEAVAEVLEGSYLSDLQHIALPPCNVDTIVKALIDGHVYTVQHLDLQGALDQWQCSRSRSLKTLFRSGLLRKLQHLRLSRCMGAEELEAMAGAIEVWKLPGLEHLDLSFNSMRGEYGSKALGKLMSCKALLELEHLNLSNCGIGDVGIQALFNAMEVRGPRRLSYLNLGSNEIGDHGFAALLRVIEADGLPQLKELHLLYNYGIGEESKVLGAQVLEKGHLPALQVLYMSSHSITDRVAAAMLTAFKNNTMLTVEMHGLLWPNEAIEREAALYRERNLGLLTSPRKELNLLNQSLKSKATQEHC